MKKNQSKFGRFGFMILMFTALGLLFIIDTIQAKQVTKLSWSSMVDMFKILPSIFILIGLLDVWVSKDTMIKYMGEHSGPIGYVIAFILGTLAAGPLYTAFPIAAILLKKQARYSYILFFLGVWSSLKVPLLLFEMTNLGLKFTVIHIVVSIVLTLVGAIVIEKSLNKEKCEEIRSTASRMIK